MKIIFLYFLKQIIPGFLIIPLLRFKKKFYLFCAIKLPILDSNEVGEVIKTIKEETVEAVIYPRIYDRVFGGRINLKSPKINLIQYKNTTVFPSSDFIITQNGVVWHKFHNPQFARMIPGDPDFLKIKDDCLFIKKPSDYKMVKVGYSLCGMYSSIWSHFLVQYLPKIYLIRDLRKVLGQSLTVILPKYNDPHIREIVYTYLKRINDIEILELKNNEVAICDSLFHIENTAFFMDNMLYTSVGEDVVIPKFVAQSLQNDLLPDLLDNRFVNDFINEKELKLYIGRKSNFRNLHNSIEVEEFFKKKGFIIIYPHTLTLCEKVRLFKQAAFVVGPTSSGFTNLIFSKPDTKVLIFINQFRCFEPYYGFLSEYFTPCLTILTGNDDPTSGSLEEERNNSYAIPLSKIIAACDEIGI